MAKYNKRDKIDPIIYKWLIEHNWIDLDTMDVRFEPIDFNERQYRNHYIINDEYTLIVDVDIIKDHPTSTSTASAEIRCVLTAVDESLIVLTDAPTIFEFYI